MKSAIGFIDLHGNPQLGKLTDKRPLGAVSFLGRYALIDFALSNFSNSDIHRTEILTERHLDSIRSHILNGNIWVTNTRTGFLRAVINENGLIDPSKNTDIANIIENVPRDVIAEDYVVIASPQFLMSIDYRDVLKAHGDAGAGITIVYKKTKEIDEYPGCDHLLLDPDGTVRRFSKLSKDEETANISLESYVMNKEVFTGLIRFSREISNTSDTFRKMIELYSNNRMTKVYAYEFKGKVFPVLSLKQYIEQSFKLLDFNQRKGLFLPEWPIYTTSHNTPPAFYGPFADVNNSFISNGAVIKGKVRNSIICRDVYIDEGAEVSDCILFTKTRVGKDVKLQYVITDKDVEINNVKNLVGDQEDYLLISKGAKI